MSVSQVRIGEADRAGFGQGIGRGRSLTLASSVTVPEPSAAVTETRSFLPAMLMLIVPTLSVPFDILIVYWMVSVNVSFAPIALIWGAISLAS